MRTLRRELAIAPLPQILQIAAALEQGGDHESAIALLESRMIELPDAAELRFTLGDLLRRLGQPQRAETLLGPLALAGDSNAQHSLALLLQAEGRLVEASRMMAALIEHDPGDAQLLLARITFVEQCQQPQLGYLLCEAALTQHQRDSALHGLAGRLAASVGDFAAARNHYLQALSSADDDAVPSLLHALSAAQRYANAAHPDLLRFREFLARPNLAPSARASGLFALAKANDDIGDFDVAAAAFREGNSLVRASIEWRRESWRSYVSQRLQEPIQPRQSESEGTAAFVPVFIVGLPRSGTTLIADRLSRHPQLRNRDELNLIPFISKRLAEVPASARAQLIPRMSLFAAAHLRQDDAPASFYLDKNPLNFLHLDLIAQLFPNARVIYCRRNARDTALSIWQQYFARGNDNGYAYAFADIQAFSEGCSQLMAHWRRRLNLPIFELRYEEMIANPEQTLGKLNEFLGLPTVARSMPVTAPASFISTSSAWQARQAIYSRSVGRWRRYADHFPELVSLFSDEVA